MTTTIKLSFGELLVKNYQANIDVFFDGEHVSHSYDGDIEYSCTENIESFIEYELSDLNIQLTNEDKEKLNYELHNFFYAHSKDCFE